MQTFNSMSLFFFWKKKTFSSSKTLSRGQIEFKKRISPIKFEKANFFRRLKSISKALINTLNAPSFSNGTKLESKIWTYWVFTKTKHGLIHENLKLNENEANEKLDQKIWHRPSRKLPTRLRILVYVKSSYGKILTYLPTFASG